LALLAEIVRFEHPNVTTSDAQIDALLMNATAMLAELEPASAAPRADGLQGWRGEAASQSSGSRLR
jgi:hypothetical protein